MLKTLQSLFFPDQPATETTRETRLDAAVAILLMEVARADFDVAEDELDVIRRTLIDDFAMAPDAAEALVRHAAARWTIPPGCFRSCACSTSNFLRIRRAR